MARRSSRLVRSCTAAFAAALLGSVLSAAPALAVEGDPVITFDGQADSLVVGDGEEPYPTDLFTSFKDLMPGDERTQEIKISFDNIHTGTRLFIKAGAPRITD